MKMNYSILLPSVLGMMLSASHTKAQGLNVSAIGTASNASTIECWNLSTAPFGAAGAINYPLAGDLTNSFIGVLPPHTHIGQAWARQIQYSIFLGGLTHIALPDRANNCSNNDEAYFQAGDILLATDLQSLSFLGHITEFPGGSETIIAQFPVADNIVPDHTVLHSGRC